MKLGVFNTRSLHNKTTQVVELLIDNDIDVCCVTETLLRPHDGALVTEIIERCNDVYHNPRKTRGEGTAVLVKSDLKSTSQATKTFQCFEVTEVLLRSKSNSIRLCSVKWYIHKLP